MQPFRRVPPARSRGFALVSVLLLATALLLIVLGAFVAAHLDGRMTEQAHQAMRALHAAEAGLHHLRLHLEPAPDFAGAAGWPGGVPPFGAEVSFPEEPVTYRVRVLSTTADTAVVTSEGTGPRRARRRIEAVFHRASQFDLPGALVVGELSSTLAGGTVSLRGGDQEPPFPATAVSETDSRRLAFGPVPVTGPTGFVRATETLRGTEDRLVTEPVGNATWGSAADPEVVRLSELATIEGTVTATGIVVAEVLLRIEGSLEVNGLLLASRGLDVRGRLGVRGGAWARETLNVPAGATMEARHEVDPLRRADELRPGLLPRPAVLGAWREVW